MSGIILSGPSPVFVVIAYFAPSMDYCLHATCINLLYLSYSLLVLGKGSPWWFSLRERLSPLHHKKRSIASVVHAWLATPTTIHHLLVDNLVPASCPFKQSPNVNSAKLPPFLEPNIPKHPPVFLLSQGCGIKVGHHQFFKLQRFLQQ